MNRKKYKRKRKLTEENFRGSRCIFSQSQQLTQRGVLFLATYFGQAKEVLKLIFKLFDCLCQKLDVKLKTNQGNVAALLGTK